MADTLYLLLTDADARDADEVEQHLSADMSVGYFWFD